MDEWINFRMSGHSPSIRLLFESVKQDGLYSSFLKGWDEIPKVAEDAILGSIASMTAEPDELVFSVDEEPDLELKYSFTFADFNKLCADHGIESNSILYLFYIHRTDQLAAEIKRKPEVQSVLKRATEDYRQEKTDQILKKLNGILRNCPDPVETLERTLKAVEGTDPFIIYQIVNMLWSHKWFFRGKSAAELETLRKMATIHQEGD